MIIDLMKKHIFQCQNMENDPYKGDWFQLYYHSKFKEIGDYQFD